MSVPVVIRGKEGEEAGGVLKGWGGWSGWWTWYYSPFLSSHMLTGVLHPSWRNVR